MPQTCLTRTAPLRETGGPHGEPAGGEERVDTALVQRCARRDPAALREIVQRYQPRLYRFLHRLIGSHEDTEEAVQDVFLRVWSQAHRFAGRASFSTWLYRIAANVAYDLLRRRKAQGQAVAPEDMPSAAMVNPEQAALDGLERAERARQLQCALQRMRVDDRLLLVLYYAEELGYDEMREITGYAYPVLKVRLMRARRRLRAAMESLAPEGLE